MLFLNAETPVSFSFSFLFLKPEISIVYILRRSQTVTGNIKYEVFGLENDHFYLHSLQEGRKMTIKQIYDKQDVNMTAPKVTQIMVCRNLQLSMKKLKKMKTNRTAF